MFVKKNWYHCELSGTEYVKNSEYVKGAIFGIISGVADNAKHDKLGACYVAADGTCVAAFYGTKKQAEQIQRNAEQFINGNIEFKIIEL